MAYPNALLLALGQFGKNYIMPVQFILIQFNYVALYRLRDFRNVAGPEVEIFRQAAANLRHSCSKFYFYP